MDDKKQTPPVSQELTTQNIAICFSGGGYRALAFHLGSLSYLDRVGLRENISNISTISGGSFAGAMYFQSLIEKQPFSVFFNQSCQRLESVNLVALGLERLSAPLETYSKRRTLIVAMAATYADQFFFKPDSKEPYLFSDFLADDLPEISLNATEFRSGVAFRFQNRKGAKVGNGNITVATVPENSERSIGPIASARIADIVASSSCFPGGFEPLAFPGDFVWKSPSEATEIYEKISPEGKEVNLAVMDGGIYDNQGAQTLDAAVGKEALDTDNLGMFLISDSDQGETDLYSYPAPEKSAGFFGRRTLRQIRWGLTSVGLLCALSAAALGFRMWDEIRTGVFDFSKDFLLHLIPFVLILITISGLWMIRKIVRDKILPNIPQIGTRSWKYLRKITVDEFIDMTNLRLSSLMAMAGSIFMKRVRGLVYYRIYRRQRYKNKLVDNLIYGLRDSRQAPSDTSSPPSDGLIKLSREAAATPTGLWFEKKDKQLEKIVACGQATLCYNLIELTQERYGKDLETYPEEVKILQQKLLKDWEEFCDDPFFAYKEIRESQAKSASM